MVLVAFFAYRLFELFVISFHSFYDALNKLKHRSKARMIASVLLKHAETILIFGFWFYLQVDSATIVKCLDYSVSLATLSGLTLQTETTSLT